MPKKLASIAVAIALSVTCIGVLAGCDSDTIYGTTEGAKVRERGGFGNLELLDDNLYYDTDTRIVYYVFAEGTGYQGFGFMSPYYSENGKLCRYVDGEIVEVGKSAK